MVAHWQAFYNAKESGVSQSVLVLGASVYWPAFSARIKRAGLSGAGGGTPYRPIAKLALPGVTCRSVDLNQPQDLPALLTGIDTLYYLVHGMGEGGDFIAHERRVATYVRDALRQSSVRRDISVRCRPRRRSSPTICALVRLPAISCVSRACR